MIVHCQRPKPKRTRKSALRTKNKRQRQDQELLDHAERLQRSLEQSIAKVLGNSNKRRK